MDPGCAVPLEPGVLSYPLPRRPRLGPVLPVRTRPRRAPRPRDPAGPRRLARARRHVRAQRRRARPAARRARIAAGRRRLGAARRRAADDAVIEAVLPRRTRAGAQGRRAAHRRAGRRGERRRRARLRARALAQRATARARAHRSCGSPARRRSSSSRSPTCCTTTSPRRSTRCAAIAVGVEVLAVSSYDGDGLDDVRALIPPGVTGAVIGPSGAGKSTLVNALVGHELLATTAVRADHRGVHTTTRAAPRAAARRRPRARHPGHARARRCGPTRTRSTSTFVDVDALAAGVPLHRLRATTPSRAARCSPRSRPASSTRTGSRAGASCSASSPTSRASRTSRLAAEERRAGRSSRGRAVRAPATERQADWASAVSLSLTQQNVRR